MRRWPKGEQGNRGQKENSLLGEGGGLKGDGRRGNRRAGAEGEVVGPEGKTEARHMSREGE